MNRLQKLLAAATLLVLPVIAACGEDPVPPPATGSIMGQVSIEGMGIDGVSVNLSNGASTTTAGGGTYRFDGVEAGAYTVTISGFPADASFDATSAAATIPENGGSVTLDFRGSYIRTASIMGTVTVENTGLGGVTVRLSGMADAQTATDNNGQYAFTGLRAGTYAVEISGFDMDEVGFGSVSSSATVGVGESKIISFDGTYLRTAGIIGQVSVEGVGLAGVTVTMTGEGEDETDVTDAGGLYGFSKLKAGNYSVAISGFDPDEVEFTSTSMNVTVALGETANIPFMGTLLRTSGISGRVSTEGEGRDGVTVTLAGAAEATQMTSNGGQYAFAGLAEGTYVVTISGWDEAAYTFETTSATIVLGDAESNITNFEGTHTRTASISGVLFIDEVMQDKMHTAGEPSLTAALAPLVEHGLLPPEMLAGLLTHAKVMLRGPDLNTMTEVAINADGTFTTGESLQAGSYQVELPANNEMVAAALAAAGVAFVGESSVVTVAAGGMETVNFPFRITMQTIGVGAVMGNEEMTGAPVKGVTLALYPTAQDAEDGMNPLSEMPMMTGETGMAAFQFARDDDTSPGSEASDNLVFVKVVETGHDDLMVSDNDIIEIEYPGIARVHAAPAHVRLLNVAVNVDFWVKSNATARSGDMGLGDWTTEVFMGDPDAEDAMALMKPDPDDETEMVNLTEPTDTTTAMDNKYLGKGTFSYRTVDEDGMPAVPATFYVRVDSAEVQKADGGEMFDAVADEVHAMGSEDGKSLMYEHTGLALPSDMNVDVGPMRITFTTQSLRVQVHRELDDVEGFTDFRAAEGGDARPNEKGLALDGLEVELLEIGSDGRARTYEYMLADGKTEAPNPLTFKASNGKYTSATFKNLPADGKFIVELSTGSGLTVASNYRDGNEVFAHGSALDDYGESAGELNSAGYVGGGFGEGVGGAHHTVELCNLARVYDDMDFGCSTFAYKWNDGSVSGSITGLRKGDEATITLTPEGDFASEFDQKKTVEATSSTNSYSFSNVADGEYDLILEGADGKWKEQKMSVTVAHMTDEESTGTKGADDKNQPLSATELRFGIKGVVANDVSGNGSVTGDEAMEGVVLELFASKARPRGHANAGDIYNNGAVEVDGVPVTTTTDGDGNYTFTQLAEATYIVMASASDDYDVVRNGNAKFEDTDQDEADEVAYMALVTAAFLDPTDTSEPAAPYWDYGTSMLHTGEDAAPGAGDFALLYEDGEIEGSLTDKSANAKKAYGETRIRLRRCLTFDDAAADPASATCDDYDGTETMVDDVSDRGNWETAGLREGYYEVAFDLPIGYALAMEDGEDADIDSWVVALDDGSRSSGQADDVYIRDNTANIGTGAPVAEAKVGRTVIADDGFVPFGTRSVSLELDPADDPDDSDGASMRVVVTATATAPTDADAAYAKGSAFADETPKTLPLVEGDNEVHVRVKSENGYNEKDHDDVYAVHRDVDTRLSFLNVFPTQDDPVRYNRARLTGLADFVDHEEDRSDEISGDRTAGTTNVHLGTITVPEGTTVVTIVAGAMSDNATVGVDGLTDGAVTTDAVTVTITIDEAFDESTEEDGTERDENSRTYTFDIKADS